MRRRPDGLTPGALRDSLRRTGAGTREALTLWLASRAALVAFSLLATWLLGLSDAARGRVGGTPLTGPTAWVLERFTWWDSFHFLRIADLGYLPDQAGTP